MKTRAPARPNFRPAGVQAALNRNHNLFGRPYFRTLPAYFRDVPVEFRAVPAGIRTAPVEFRAIPGCSGLIQPGPAYKYRGGGGTQTMQVSVSAFSTSVRSRRCKYHQVVRNPLIDIISQARHRLIMRTTLNLDEDVLELANCQAKLRIVSLGRTVSDLLRRGLGAATASEDKGGIVVFKLPADSPAVTTEDVRRLETEGA